MEQYQGLLGIFALIGIAWALSERRRAVRPLRIAGGLGIQLLLALLLLYLPPMKALFLGLNRLVLLVQQATQSGTGFVFGYLGGSDAPFTVEHPQHSFILAFQALPLVLVVSALSSMLFYWRVLPLLVNGMSWLLQKAFGIGGALGLGAAANIFVGMTEAPLLIKPYLSRLSRSELFALMSCGMATIAGTVMVLYASIIGSLIPDAMGHILIASLLSAPAALVFAHILVPETPDHRPDPAAIEPQASSTMDAVTKGTIDGLRLLLNIIAMLVVLVALVHLANLLLGLLPSVAEQPLTLQRLLGWLMAPLVWLIGIPWQEAQAAGALMGVKTALNEFLAYLQMAELDADQLSDRSRLIMTYALCGFANFGSLGIMIGGLAGMAPERRAEIVGLGTKSIISGTLATLMTGALIGILT
jgi:CNT family concentrative nucleoside transporter